jgi:hypothetical protein
MNKLLGFPRPDATTNPLAFQYWERNILLYRNMLKKFKRITREIEDLPPLDEHGKCPWASTYNFPSVQLSRPKWDKESNTEREGARKSNDYINDLLIAHSDWSLIPESQRPLFWYIHATKAGKSLKLRLPFDYFPKFDFSTCWYDSRNKPAWGLYEEARYRSAILRDNYQMFKDFYPHFEHYAKLYINEKFLLHPFDTNTFSCWQLILPFVKPSELLLLGATCKTLGIMIYNDELWRDFFQQNMVKLEVVEAHEVHATAANSQCTHACEEYCSQLWGTGYGRLQNNVANEIVQNGNPYKYLRPEGIDERYAAPHIVDKAHLCNYKNCKDSSHRLPTGMMHLKEVYSQRNPQPSNCCFLKQIIFHNGLALKQGRFDDLVPILKATYAASIWNQRFQECNCQEYFQTGTENAYYLLGELREMEEILEVPTHRVDDTLGYCKPSCWCRVPPFTFDVATMVDVPGNTYDGLILNKSSVEFKEDKKRKMDDLLENDAKPYCILSPPCSDHKLNRVNEVLAGDPLKHPKNGLFDASTTKSCSHNFWSAVESNKKRKIDEADKPSLSELEERDYDDEESQSDFEDSACSNCGSSQCSGDDC